jgi:hypothetical protein
MHLPDDGLAPLYHGTLDSILHEKRKDILGYLMGGIGRGRADRTESLRVVLSVCNK